MKPETEPNDDPEEAMAAAEVLLDAARDKMTLEEYNDTYHPGWRAREANRPPYIPSPGSIKPMPATFKASTLRQIAGWISYPMSCPYTDKDIANWAILLNQIADELEGG